MFERRTFLRQLATLPLVGGGITLIGQPTAVAEPVTTDLLDTYYSWLGHEFDRICLESYGRERWRDAMRYRHLIGPGYDFHRGIGCGPYTDPFGNKSPLPSSRAALVLSTARGAWPTRPAIFCTGGRDG